jgi:hypothetical protein
LCTYLPAPVPLADRIELLDAPTTSRRIRLLGREDDLVKIGGKRASLAGLTATLRRCPAWWTAQSSFLPTTPSACAQWSLRQACPPPSSSVRSPR